MSTYYYVAGVVIWFGLSFAWATATSKLARIKGYTSKDGREAYFATGFFFWFVGLVYVVGLPVRNTAMKGTADSAIPTKTEEIESDQGYWNTDPERPVRRRRNQE